MFRSSSETNTVHEWSQRSCFLSDRKCRLTLDVLSDERVVHDVAVIRLQDLLKLCDVIVLVGAETGNNPV